MSNYVCMHCRHGDHDRCDDLACWCNAGDHQDTSTPAPPGQPAEPAPFPGAGFSERDHEWLREQARTRFLTLLDDLDGAIDVTDLLHRREQIDGSLCMGSCKALGDAKAALNDLLNNIDPEPAGRGAADGGEPAPDPDATLYGTEWDPRP